MSNFNKIFERHLKKAFPAHEMMDEYNPNEAICFYRSCNVFIMSSGQIVSYASKM